tara:strand:+ start:538 stop:744 length:207 start_codon:yes stop_codon:yes gene_type:complete
MKNENLQAAWKQLLSNMTFIATESSLSYSFPDYNFKEFQEEFEKVMLEFKNDDETKAIDEFWRDEDLI